MPKGKKSKGKGGGGGDSGYYEAITNYKISLKQTELTELKQQLGQVTTVNNELRAKNAKLGEKREENMNKALRDYRAFFKQLHASHADDVDNFAIQNELKDMFNMNQAQARELIGIRKEMRRTDREIDEAVGELRVLDNFKVNGRLDLDNQIRLLRKELANMNENYSIITSSLKTNFVNYVDEVFKNTNHLVEKESRNVAEKTFENIEKHCVDKSLDNKWMRGQIDAYKRQLFELKQAVARLEEDNIKLTDYLLECNGDEIKSIGNMLHAQFGDDENLDETSFMNVDLENLNSVRLGSESLLPLRKRVEAMAKASAPFIAKRDQLQKLHHQRENATERGDEVNSLMSEATKSSLSLVGKRKDLIRTASPSTVDPSQMIDWPITQQMLAQLLDSLDLNNSNSSSNKLENNAY